MLTNHNIAGIYLADHRTIFLDVNLVERRDNLLNMALPALHHDCREVLLRVGVPTRIFVRMHSRQAHVVYFVTEFFDLLGWLRQTLIAHHLDWQDEFPTLEALVH